MRANYLTSIAADVSTFTDGLIVNDNATLVIYLPFAVDGFNLLIVDNKVFKFSSIADSEKDAFPIPA